MDLLGAWPNPPLRTQEALEGNEVKCYEYRLFFGLAKLALRFPHHSLSANCPDSVMLLPSADFPLIEIPS